MVRASVSIVELALLIAPPCLAGAQDLVPNAVACAGCEIEMRTVARLGDVTGPGQLPGMVPSDVVIDAKKRYWLTYSAEPPLVFDSTGRFVSQVGRRGPGPGEYYGPRRLSVVSDSVIVFDLSGRATVVGPDLRFSRAVQIPGLTVNAGIPVRWPSVLLVAGVSRTPDRAGLPLHLVDASGSLAQIGKSYGSADGALRPIAQAQLARLLWQASDHSVWSIEMLRYRIAQWGPGGELRRELIRRPPWFVGTSTGSPGSAQRAPDSFVAGLAVDSAGLVWVFTRVPSNTWRAAWERIAREHGKPDVAPGTTAEVPGHFVPTAPELYATMIEVIDPVRKVVVTRYRLDRYLARPLPERRAALYAEAADGSPFAEIVQFSIRQPGR